MRDGGRGTRTRVLRLVRERRGAVDASELAERIGVHVTTVRFHLDALCDQGAIARTRIAPSGVGRPRTGYVAVADRLDYQSLAEILALELGDTAHTRRRRAERAGRQRAIRLHACPVRDLARAQPRGRVCAAPGAAAGFVGRCRGRRGTGAVRRARTVRRQGDRP